MGLVYYFGGVNQCGPLGGCIGPCRTVWDQVGLRAARSITMLGTSEGVWNAVGAFYPLDIKGRAFGGRHFTGRHVGPAVVVGCEAPIEGQGVTLWTRTPWARSTLGRTSADPAPPTDPQAAVRATGSCQHDFCPHWHPAWARTVSKPHWMLTTWFPAVRWHRLWVTTQQVFAPAPHWWRQTWHPLRWYRWRYGGAGNRLRYTWYRYRYGESVPRL